MTSLLFFASSTLSPCSVPPLYNLIEVRKGRKEGGRDVEGERGSERAVEGWMEGEMEVKGRREGKEETHIHYNKKRIIQRLMVSTLFSQ